MSANTQQNDENPADGRSASNGELGIVTLPTLEVGIYDPFSDSIVIEGTKYSGHLFREGFGIKAMIGQILRIDEHEHGYVTVTRLRDMEPPNISS